MEKSTKGKDKSGFLGMRKQAVQVMAPMAGQGKRYSPSAVTEMPPITNPHHEVLEIYPVQDPFSFIRIIYDTQENEHFYQVIEPSLGDKDKRLLTDIKDALGRVMTYEFDKLAGVSKDEYLRQCVESFCRSRGIKLGPIDRKRIEYYIIRDFIGNSVVDVMVRDDEIEDISCDGFGIPLYVYHRKYESMRSNIIFENEDALNSFVVTLSQRSAKQISVASPILDGTMLEGHRVQATYSKEVTSKGSTFTIRRFKEKPFTPVDMLKYKTVSPEMMAYIWLGVENGESMIIVGGTASGKTSTLNSICLFIPPAAKIVSIEDTREINLPHENWIPSMTRSGIGEKDAEGYAAGEIDMYDLVRASLRQRPNYILVGEVRGKEAYVMFQAMATGHSTYSTMHADSVKSMVNRLENPPINCPRILLTALRNVMIQGQVRVGNDLVRRMKQLTEIVGFEPETNELITNTVYEWDQATDRFLYKGHSFLFDKIMEMKSLTQAEMMEEFERRIEIIRYMLAKDLRDHRQIWAVTNSYYRDPTRTINRVRREMQEVGRSG